MLLGNTDHQAEIGFDKVSFRFFCFVLDIFQAKFKMRFVGFDGADESTLGYQSFDIGDGDVISDSIDYFLGQQLAVKRQVNQQVI